MKTIITKSLRPTNAHGARIKVMSWAGNMVVPYPDSPGIGSHKIAANIVIDKMNRERGTRGFTTVWYIASWGITPSDDGFVFLIDQKVIGQ